jgi:hypothetical protein
MSVTDKKDPRSGIFNSRDTGPRRFACARCGEGNYPEWIYTKSRLCPEGPVCHTCYQRAWRASKPAVQHLIACATCGESFTSKRSDAKFCSDRCRQCYFFGLLPEYSKAEGGSAPCLCGGPRWSGFRRRLTIAFRAALSFDVPLL